jgi:hypothetical protein
VPVDLAERADFVAALRAELERRGIRRHSPGGHPHNQQDHAGDAGSAIKDALKLAGRIDLAPGERLVGSSKVDGDGGTVRLAWTERDGRRRLRLGIGDADFGGRDDEAGPWRAGPDHTADENRRRAAQRQELAELEALDKRTPEQDRRLDELANVSTADVEPAGYTANLDEAAAGTLADELRGALDQAEAVYKSENAYYDRIDDIERERNKLKFMDRKWTAEEEARWDNLTAQLEQLKANPPTRPAQGYYEFDGVIPGEWADVHYSVTFDDPSFTPEVSLTAVPPGIDPDDLSGERANLEPSETRKLLRLLAPVTAERSRIERAEPQGGQFALGGGRVAAGAPKPKQQRKKAAPGSVLGYNPKTGQGTGYGSKSGDSRVRGLQEALNKLGLTDSSGKPLKVDGKLGPKTTAAIKKLQQQLGMTPNGRVTPLFLSKITGAESIGSLKANLRKPKPAERSAFIRALGVALLPDDHVERHGTHDQSSHGRRGGRGAVKAAAKKAASIALEDLLDGRGAATDNYKMSNVAAARVAKRWKVSDADFEALAKEDGGWSDLADLPATERRERFIARQLNSWNGSSGGPVATAAITAVLDRIGVDYTLSPSEQRQRDFIRSRPEMDRAAGSLGEAMYESTQAWLKERGITHVKAFRGSRGEEWDKSRPFTSWSASRTGTRNADERIIREVDIPAERVFSLPGTGYGALDELEIVALAV